MSNDDIKDVTKSLGDVVLDAAEHESEYRADSCCFRR